MLKFWALFCEKSHRTMSFIPRKNPRFGTPVPSLNYCLFWCEYLLKIHSFIDSCRFESSATLPVNSRYIAIFYRHANPPLAVVRKVIQQTAVWRVRRCMRLLAFARITRTSFHFCESGLGADFSCFEFFGIDPWRYVVFVRTCETCELKLFFIGIYVREYILQFNF